MKVIITLVVIYAIVVIMAVTLMLLSMIPNG